MRCVNARGYAFREASESDHAGIEALFEEIGIGPGWANWKYSRNPDGTGRVFVAEDASGKIVGILGHTPRQFISQGTTFSVLQVVDILVAEALRKEGIFLGLLQHSLRNIKGARVGLPNEASGAFGAGLGWKPQGLYESWQFPLKIGESLTGIKRAIGRPLLNALSWVYRSFRLRGSRNRAFTMKRIKRFDRDYALDPRVIHGVRSSDYLNWRFIDNPVGRYFAYEFFEGNEPAGYCVFSRSGTAIILADFVAPRSPRVCLRLLVDLCLREKASRLVMRGSGLELDRLGFLRGRRKRSSWLGTGLPEGRWLITGCDIDSEPDRQPVALSQPLQGLSR